MVDITKKELELAILALMALEISWQGAGTDVPALRKKLTMQLEDWETKNAQK